MGKIMETIFSLTSMEKREAPKQKLEYVNPCANGGLPFAKFLDRGTALNLSTAYRCVELISDSIGTLPFQVKKVGRKGKSNVMENHPLVKIVYDKENRLTKFMLFKLLVQSVILKGNGFAYIKRANDGTPIGLRYLEPTDVTINFNKQTNELYYLANKVTPGRINPKDMLHFVKNSYDGVNGVSLISYASRSLRLANDTESSASRFFGSGCNLSGILKIMGNPTQEQMLDAKNTWNVVNNDGLAVMKGNMEYTPIQLNATDSQLIESRQYNVQDICRFFGVSPILVGDLSHTSFSTIEAVQNEFLTHTLAPYISMMEDELNRKLVAQDNIYINLDETAILRTDKQQLATYYNTLLNSGVLSINEVRKELGYNEVEGLDEHHIPYNSSAQSALGNDLTKDTLSVNETNTSQNEDITNDKN